MKIWKAGEKDWQGIYNKDPNELAIRNLGDSVGFGN